MSGTSAGLVCVDKNLMFSTPKESRDPRFRGDDGAFRAGLSLAGLCNGGVVVQCSGKANQLHKLAAVTMCIVAPGVTGQLGDIRVAKTLQVGPAAQFLSKCCNGCGKVETVAAMCRDLLVQDG